jgi:hypothetical protein
MLSLLGLFVGRTSAQVASATGPWQQPTVSPQGQSLQWVQIPQIEKELEIVPEQKEALAKLRTATYEKVRSLWPATGEGTPQERQQKYYAAAQSLADETERNIREILLPHQVRRLSQVMLQMKLAQAGYRSTQTLATGDVAEELGITDEQRTQLQQAEQEVMQEMRVKLLEFQRKLQEESREKLLGVLTAAQRRQLDAMLGDKFEWQSPAVGANRPVQPAGGTTPVSPAPSPAPAARMELKPAENGKSPLPRLPQGD